MKRNAKDTVFRTFFQERENVFELYKELHPEDTSSTKDDVVIRTVGRVVVKGFTNDLGFSVGDRSICLVESQSYRLRSFIMRTLFYLAETYQAYLDDNRLDIYEADDRDAPEWEAYVVSTAGLKGRLLELRNIPKNLGDESAAAEIGITDEGLISGYIEACRIIDTVISKDEDEYGRDAVLRAFEECRDRCGKVGKFIWSKRSEAMGVYEQLFDEEENMNMNRRVFFRKGLAEGERRGLAEGERKGLVEGEENERRRIVSRLLSSGMPPEDVARIVGVPPEEISKMSEGVRSGLN